MDCPSCGEFNSMLAERCACGHEFERKANAGKPHSSAPAAPPGPKYRGAPLLVSGSSAPRPPEVPAAIALTAVPVAIITAAAGLNVTRGARLGLTILLLYGLWKGHPLAWRYQVIILPAVGAVAAFNAIMHFSDRNPFSATMMAVFAANCFAIPFLLNRERCRRFFNLQCPQCASLKTTAGNLFYNVHRCKKCNIYWVRGNAP